MHFELALKTSFVVSDLYIDMSMESYIVMRQTRYRTFDSDGMPILLILLIRCSAVNMNRLNCLF